MLPTTLQAIRSILTADPSVNPVERNRIVTLLRYGPPSDDRIAAPVTPVKVCLIRRKEVAERLSVSLRTVDSLAQSGTLHKRTFPGRVRASGFLESEVDALLTGRISAVMASLADGRV
jgi:predicted DNA-binding transcriptional regulator AlpA